MSNQKGFATLRSTAVPAHGLEIDSNASRSDALVRREDALRWVAVGVFSLFSLLSFLDRQLLAALAPAIKAEFSLTNAEYGAIVSAFSLAYMLMTPLAGWFVDRVGLNLGAMLAVGFWSLAGSATAVAGTFRGLLLCRVGLGLGEAAGIPSSAKAGAVYLQPREWAIGAAVQQIGLFSGGIAAPLLAAAIASRYGWRAAFVFAGALGFLWIPIWWWTSRRIPSRERADDTIDPVAISSVIRDARMWGIVVCSLTIMTLYSLWLNWTTILFVQQFGLTQNDANRYFAWIPPVFATLGGFFGGVLALRRVDAGENAVRARLGICWKIAPVSVIAALVPWTSSPAVAAAAISVSFFVCMALVTNLHVIPIDLFGVKRAAFTSSILTCAFALMQTLVAPAIGAFVDRFGFGPVCAVFAVLPLFGLSVANVALRSEQ